MKQIKVNIYLKNIKKPSCTVIFSKNEQVAELIDEMNSGKQIIYFYNIVFNINEFKYLTIEEKN